MSAPTREPMTVRELIERLRAMPQDLPVLVTTESGLDHVQAVQRIRVARYAGGRGSHGGLYVEVAPWNEGVPTEGEPQDAVLIDPDPAEGGE